ncbi:MAG: zinc ribbon domain-containing protein [Calditrichia bacterium]
MPLYEYLCKDCGEKFEELVSFARSNEMECPKCGSANTEKQVSLFATAGGSAAGGGGSCGSGGSGHFT